MTISKECRWTYVDDPPELPYYRICDDREIEASIEMQDYQFCPYCGGAIIFCDDGN